MSDNIHVTRYKELLHSHKDFVALLEKTAEEARNDEANLDTVIDEIRDMIEERKRTLKHNARNIQSCVANDLKRGVCDGDTLSASLDYTIRNQFEGRLSVIYSRLEDYYGYTYKYDCHTPLSDKSERCLSYLESISIFVLELLKHFDVEGPEYRRTLYLDRELNSHRLVGHDHVNDSLVQMGIHVADVRDKNTFELLCIAFEFRCPVQGRFYINADAIRNKLTVGLPRRYEGTKNLVKLVSELY